MAREINEILRDAATRVAGWVANRDNKTRFRNQLERAKNKDIACLTALTASMKKALAEPELRDNNARLRGDWEWDCCRYNTNFFRKELGEGFEQVEQGFWRRPLPFSPARWAEYHYCYDPDLFGTFAEPTEPKNDEESLLSAYVFLTELYHCIHKPPDSERLHDSYAADDVDILYMKDSLDCETWQQCLSDSDKATIESRIGWALSAVASRVGANNLDTYEPAKRLADAYGLPVKRVRSELSKEYWGPGGTKANNPRSPQLRTAIEDAGGKDAQYLWRSDLVKPILERLAEKPIRKH
jgi:hypothetical protein